MKYQISAKIGGIITKDSYGKHRERNSYHADGVDTVRGEKTHNTPLVYSVGLNSAASEQFTTERYGIYQAWT